MSLVHKFEEAHSFLDKAATSALLKEEYFTTELRQQFYKTQTSVLLSISSRRSECIALKDFNDSSSGDRSQSKLPKLKIPVFQGTYAEWPIFKKMFESMVLSDKRLSDFKRLHYLRSSLGGKPEKLIFGFPLVSSLLKLSWVTIIKVQEQALHSRNLAWLALLISPSPTRATSKAKSQPGDKAPQQSSETYIAALLLWRATLYGNLQWFQGAASSWAAEIYGQ